MDNYKINIEKVSLSNPDRTRKFVSAFNYGDTNNSDKKERMSFLLEIEYKLVPTPEDLVWTKGLSEGLITLIKEAYFGSEAPFTGVYERFESFLQDLNKFFSGYDLKDKTLNVIIAVFDSPNVHFAQIGSPLAYLGQNGELIELGQENKSRKFSNIISGTLEDNDQLFFGTSNLFDYLPEETIEENLRDKNEISIKKLNAALKKFSQKVSLGLITIKNPIIKEELEEKSEPVKEAPAEVKEPESTPESEPTPIPEPIKKQKRGKKNKQPVEKIIEEKKDEEASEVSAEENPEETKDDKIIVEDQEESRSIVSPKIKNQVTPVSSEESEAILQELSIGGKPDGLEPPPPPLIWRIILTIGATIYHGVKYLFNSIKKTNTTPTTNKAKQIFGKISARSQRFSPLQRLLIILLLIVAILLTTGLIIACRQEFNRQNAKKSNVSIQQIKDLEQQMYSALIYKDKAKATSIYSQITILLKTLPQQTEAQRTAYNELKADIDKQAAPILHQEISSNLKLVADLSKVDKQISVGGLTKLGSFLYFFNPTNNYIYKIDLATNKVDLAHKGSVDVGYLKEITPLDKDSLLFSHNNNGLATYNTVNDNFTSIDLQTSHQNLTMQDFLVYADKLYILDAKDSLILKYTKTASGFGKEENWLTSAAGINNGVSFAADGAIYVMLDNGQMIKFYRGAKQNFNLKNILPVLQKPTKIFTDADHKYLYVLEPTNQRLVIFDKTGELIKQISAPELGATTDFVINDKADTAWILNDKKVYQVGLK
ncbi:MAG: hypothetical protein PHV78_03350 [Patescibacteria group bacterium]|nr:hypothetical protein [Patescibacteria group bacterium]MDD5121577.1 hypothetical protein [Patescibacteria group bacterium]MDD5222118.1 hypothetical protein [Patescibacteria group bacterium]MDD5396259.1 hypothetical protein [Patescibacteria group bacterium]